MGVKPFEGKSNAKSRLLCVDTCSGSICRGCSIYRLFKRLIQAGYRLPPPPGCPQLIYHLMIQCW